MSRGSSAASNDVDDEVAPSSSATAGTSPSAGTLPGGSKIGRYMVLYRHGRGGMGHVYAAYDPELDRKIAIKLLRRTNTSKKRASTAQARLLREAQALARLSHPNVVSIHDVGLHDGRVFVAMAFVEGLTLRRWLAATERTWREIIDVFLQAGRGLAAAHGAELIHRDFKPENVIVDAEGKAQVLDFGLARSREALSDERGRSRDTGDRVPPEEITGSLRRPITREGAIVGTPAYMSPEQHRGKPADARSDQFAFCVALFESLYGEHPFVASDNEDLKAAVLAGSVREPTVSRRVPRWIRAVLLRGLSSSAAQRFPTMQELLAELSPERRRKRRRVVSSAATVLVVALGAYVGGTHVAGGASRCAEAEQDLASIWDDKRKSEIRAAFEATGKPYAQTVFDSSAALLDAYAEEWTAMRVASCRATFVDESQSEEVFLLRSQCLQQRRDDMVAVTDLLAQADDTVVERAVQTVHSLPAVSQCKDVSSVASVAPTPDDARARTEVEATRAKLAQARAYEQAGKYAIGLRLARAAVERANQIGFRPLQAEALLARGILQQRAGQTSEAEQSLRDAIFAAEGGGHTLVAAQAWIELLEVARVQPSLHDETEYFIRHAEALVERVETGAMLEASLLYNMGNLLHARGRYAEAVDVHRRGLELREELLGPRHPDVGASLRGLGIALEGAGRFDEALVAHQRAESVLEAILGGDHPEIARVLNARAIVHDDLGQTEQSRPLYQQAVEVFEQALGPDHPDVATGVNNLAGLHFADGDYQAAYAGFSRALKIWEKTYGPDHPDVALTLGNLGLALEALGRHEDALTHHKRALALRESTLGTDHPDVAVSLRNLGDLYVYLDRADEALPLHRRALDILERGLGSDHPRVATAMVRLGLTYERRGQYDKALDLHNRALAIRRKALAADHYEIAEALARRGIVRSALGDEQAAQADLEQAISLYDKHQLAYAETGEARFALARLLHALDARAQRDRVRELAERALQDYGKDGWDYPDDEAKIRAFLRRRG